MAPIDLAKAEEHAERLVAWDHEDALIRANFLVSAGYIYELCSAVRAVLGAARQQPLTLKQAAVLRFLADYRHKRGCMPSFEEIAAHFHWRSLATVHEHLTNLTRKGWIRRDYNMARAITLIGQVPE